MKIRNYKKQVEDAEEIAALNLVSIYSLSFISLLYVICHIEVRHKC